MADLDRIYAHRFEDPDARTKDRVWVEIGRYLQRYVDAGSPVLDIACDRGYFIRNVSAAEKWASDMRDVSGSLPPEVHFVERVVVRFLPYTTKSRLPQHPILLRSYLRVRLAWRLLGGQTLYVGRRPLA